MVKSSFAAALICLLGWSVISHVSMLPGISPVASEMLKYCFSTEFLIDIAHSWLRIITGFILSVLIGFGFGLISGYGGFVGNTLLKIADVFRPIPAISFLPVVSLIFTSVDIAILAVILVGGVFPIFISVSSGLRNISSERLINVGRSFCACSITIFWMIKVPLALKSVGIGIQTSAGTIWTVLVTAEMLSGKGGLGYKTWESYTLLNYPKVLAGMILIGVSGYILNFGVNKLFKHFFGGYYVD